MTDPDQVTSPPDGRQNDEQARWRREFPIHQPEDEYVSRREFTKFMALTSLALVIGQFWILIQNLLRRAGRRPPIVPIARSTDVAVGATIGFAYPGPRDRCVLVRLTPDRFVAYSQVCTHLSCAVIPRPDLGRILCPCHDGAFDLASGRPVAGPPQRPLPAIEIEVRGGVVYATGVEVRTT